MSISIKLRFFLIQLFVLGYVFANVAYPLLTQQILDRLSGQDFAPIRMLFVLLFGAIVLLIASARGRALTQKRYLNQIKQYYREKVLDCVFYENSEKLSSEQEAEFLSVFNNDIPMVCHDYYETILNMIYSCMTIAFSLFALANINGIVALLIVLNFVALATVPLLFKEQLQRAKNRISDTLKQYNVKLKDSIFCMPLMKSYRADREILDRVSEAGRQANDADYHNTKVQENANLSSMVIGYLNDFCILIIGVYLIAKGKISIGALLAIIQISNLIANPITTLSYHINMIHSVMPIKKKLCEMVQQPTAHPKPEHRPLPCVSKIELKDVSVTREGRQILDHVTVTFEQGKRYLILGENGSGKSTLLKVLNRNIPANQGLVLVDGIPIHQIDDDDFSRNILMDYQEPYLFTASVRDNIGLYQNYPEETIREIAQKLNISSLVEDPDETRVHHLSGGEKQRVALARLLLRNPAIFLLDEAFSAVDFDARKELEQYLFQQNYSFISVSHTDANEILSQYDEIIVLQKGKIIEQGSFRQLMERQQYFYSLYHVTGEIS
jgi:ABC-type multidrug transport system fused ATPase/permease subunit